MQRFVDEILYDIIIELHMFLSGYLIIAYL